MLLFLFPAVPLIRSTWLLFALTSWSMLQGISHLRGQTASEAPAGEYYAARDLYETGRLAEAIQGLQASAKRALRIDNQLWIDSIPNLVMQAECYLQQGKLALAMEHYDQALIVLLTYPDWMQQLDFSAGQLSAQEIPAGNPPWFPAARPTQVAVYPERGVLNVTLGKPQTGSLQPSQLVTRVDAAEILRCVGLALVRRWETLGPLLKYSPLTQPLSELLQRDIAQSAAWFRSSWLSLGGLQQLLLEPASEASQKFVSSTSTSQAPGDFMTPLVHLTIGKSIWQSKDATTAMPFLQHSVQVSARLEQWAMLAESQHILSAAAVAGNRIDLLPGLQAAAAAGNKRSLMAQAYGYAGVAELAACAGNTTAADGAIKLATAALRGVDMALPMAQARLAHAAAVFAYGENDRGTGQQQFAIALKLMQGNAQDGSAARQIFQTQMVLDLLQANALPVVDIEQLLGEILREPSTYQWQANLMENIAAMTTSALPAYTLWLDLAERRGTPADIIARMDRALCQRFFEALPMGGRLFSWRAAILGVEQRLPIERQKQVQQILETEPVLADAMQKFTALCQQLKQLPLPVDERKLSGETRKRFAEQTRLVELIENQIRRVALKRKPFDRFLPQAATLEQVQAALKPGDLMLAWVTVGDRLQAAAIHAEGVETWSVPKSLNFSKQIESLLDEIGLQGKDAPRAALANEAAWRVTAQNLFEGLIPERAQTLVAVAKRLIIVPDGPLWYLPFDLLPESSKTAAEPWLVRRPIVYLPTLGSVALMRNDPPTVRNSLVVASTYFANDKALNEQLTNSLLAMLDQPLRSDSTARPGLPANLNLQLYVDQLLVTHKVEATAMTWDIDLFPLDGSRYSKLSGLVESPRRAPLRILMPGYETLAARGTTGDGREIFLPACALLHSGSRSMLLSRWSVGGRSSHAALKRFLSELTSECASVAWQRSALALWAEDFPVADEPAFKVNSKDLTLISGLHPKLWSGYMVIGDTCK